MPALFRIFPDHNLVYVRYFGIATIADYISVVEGYTKHPDYDVTRKNLVDLSQLQDVERDYTAIMKLQARIAEFAVGSPSDILSVVIANSQIGREAAQLVFKSWENIDTPVVRRIAPDLETAASLLGMKKTVLTDLVSQIA